MSGLSLFISALEYIYLSLHSEKNPKRDLDTDVFGSVSSYSRHNAFGTGAKINL